MFDHIGVERLSEARRLAEQMGALSTVAILDLQLSACFTGRWDLDRCDGMLRLPSGWPSGSASTR